MFEEDPVHRHNFHFVPQSEGRLASFSSEISFGFAASALGECLPASPVCSAPAVLLANTFITSRGVRKGKRFSPR